MNLTLEIVQTADLGSVVYFTDCGAPVTIIFYEGNLKCFFGTTSQLTFDKSSNLTFKLLCLRYTLLLGVGFDGHLRLLY